MQVRYFVAIAALSSARIYAGLIAPGPPCQDPISYQELIEADETGCSVGQFTVLNASFVAHSGPLTASDITVTFSSDSGVGVNLAGDFSSAAGESLHYTLQYTVDPPPEIILGQRLEMFDFGDGSVFSFARFALAGFGFGIQATPAVQVDVKLCIKGLFDELMVCKPTGDVESFTITNTTPRGSVAFTNPTNWVDVNLDIFLNDGGFLGSLQSTSVASPEPGTWGLLGAGLVALVALRRRRRRL
jgi:hypothetical protein